MERHWRHGLARSEAGPWRSCLCRVAVGYFLEAVQAADGV